ncbi:anti-sigma regulatory factor (Ser/Thr protein kinase) [Thermocatellispora tengchongensis]|uniref:Anti-sigma regulatory factor (Ser/Thr protein kinase) n=1 Tax=Thermocatellispora tengchongensis TaxID=1073253 RepID=A0A840NT54_9ACTN|nr:ATP-binding protein [Thermocatellispora tengchongensis]MBB5131884.1 anti-sigma regulatory factor (Ser/Thr protein kinase) [Thermocatellispora tengchongensis]
MNEDTVPPARFVPGAEPRFAVGAESTSGGGGVREFTFRLADLPAVRDFAASCARRLGYDEDFINDFLLAINEVATNAVTHGADKGEIRIWPGGERRLFVAVHDSGRWAPKGTPGSTPPAPNATSGMGLWVARKLASSITFATGSTGTTVTMGFEA